MHAKTPNALWNFLCTVAVKLQLQNTCNLMPLLRRLKKKLPNHVAPLENDGWCGAGFEVKSILFCNIWPYHGHQLPSGRRKNLVRKLYSYRLHLLETREGRITRLTHQLTLPDSSNGVLKIIIFMNQKDFLCACQSSFNF